LLAGLVTQSVCGQSPGLAWTTNIGARLFAVDAQTNVYANVGGAVIQLTSAGVPTQTNTICPVPGIARRDGDGNFYFGGNFDGTQDFGGITLVGGWIDMNYFPPAWRPGRPTCYLAKYSAGGNLQWAVEFGQRGTTNSLTDLLLDS